MSVGSVRESRRERRFKRVHGDVDARIVPLQQAAQWWNGESISSSGVAAAVHSLNQLQNRQMYGISIGSNQRYFVVGCMIVCALFSAASMVRSQHARQMHCL